MKSLRLIAMASTALLLASCSTTTQQQETPPATPVAEEKAAPKTTVSTPTPTAEQQAAAAQSMQTQQSGSSVEATEETLNLPTAPAYQPTSSIPGRRGLRMGHFAPPEEAASTGENKAPTPNAVDLHGLRSPSLPQTLPLDVNGQRKKN